MTTGPGRFVCDQCGGDVRRYVTLFGTAWSHVDGAEGAACADFRGDRDFGAAWQAGLSNVLRDLTDGIGRGTGAA